MRFIKGMFILILLCVTQTVLAGNSNGNWQQWEQQLRAEAIAEGIRPELFDEIFADIHQPNKQVLRFDKTQPEKRITFMKYRSSRIDAYRIKLGISEYKQNQELLHQIGDQFGVNPCFVVALWGIESSYGRYMGDFSVIKALATLAYDDRRADFFRKELLIALHILNDEHVDIQHFKGEWAGASGHPQFLPSSWQRYAVDYDGDQHRDIWRSEPDALASIANYLKENGWQSNEPWGIEVDLPAGFPTDIQTVKIQKPVQEWLNMGVKPAYGETLPSTNIAASIVTPYGGPSFMVFQNFRTLLRYNNSIFYAASVSYLADQICKRSQQQKVF